LRLPRCCRHAADSARRATDQRAGGRTPATTDDAANRRTRAGTEQAATNSPITRVVRIAGGQGQQAKGNGPETHNVFHVCLLVYRSQNQRVRADGVPG
jgi:hypothetical protein